MRRGGEGRGGEGKTRPMGGARQGGGGLARRDRDVARQGGCQTRAGGYARPGGGVGRRDGMECRTGIYGGRTGWVGVQTGRTQGTAGEGVRTKGKGETGSLDHVRMQYVGSSGASSCSSSVELSVLSSSSCSGNPLRRCRTSFLMTILLVC
jgi:hypothetical protein